jgi:hypothetical protein
MLQGVWLRIAAEYLADVAGRRTVQERCKLCQPETAPPAISLYVPHEFDTPSHSRDNKFSSQLASPLRLHFSVAEAG